MPPARTPGRSTCRQGTDTQAEGRPITSWKDTHTMAKVRKNNAEAQTLEIFEIELEDGDLEAMRPDPEQFFRELLEPDYKVNGICIDARHVSRLHRGESLETSFVTLVHISGGVWDSYYVW